LKEKHRSSILKYIIGLMMCFCFSLTGFSQKGNMEKGDRYYDLNLFTEAIEFYLLATKEGKAQEKEAAMIQLGNCYRITGQFEEAEKTFQKILKNKKTPASSYLNYALALKASSKYTEAIASFEKYRTKNPSDSSTANRMIKSCLLAQHWLDEEIEYDVNLVDKLSGEAPDFAANYYENGVFICSSREGSLKPLINFSGSEAAAALDYYFMDISGPVDSIKSPLQFPGKLNTISHEGPGSFTKDFSTLYITKTVTSAKSKSQKRLKTLQIFVTKKDSTGNWKVPVSAFTFNSFQYSTGHPSISKDGNRVYFMSDMPGGKGGTDIYYTQKQKNGTWGKPVNLGKPVNTSGNELFPFISDDSVLYFSSNMHPGMGKLDIFSTKQVSDSLWTEPENMRPPINTIGDDFGFVKDSKGNRGFLSSDRFNGKGADDIYTFSHHDPFEINVEGTKIQILDQTFYDGVVYKLVNDSTKAEQILQTEKGIYSANMEPNTSYTLVARKNGFRYAKVSLTRQIPPIGNQISFLIRPMDKTVKVAGTLYKLDSSQTNIVSKLADSPISLLENDAEISNKHTDTTGRFSFNYELTSGNSYLLIDNESIQVPETISNDTNRVLDSVAVLSDFPDTLRQDTTLLTSSQSMDTVKIVPLPKVFKIDTTIVAEKLLFKGMLNSDGKKMSNVALKLYNGDSLQQSAKSDGMGMFQFMLNSQVPEYTIFASKPGFESKEITIKTAEYKNATTAILRIEMIEKERVDVNGVIKTRDTVIVNAQIDLYSSIEDVKTQLTDNNGAFKFSLNPDGEYSMTVNKKGMLPKKVDIAMENIGENGDLDLAIEMDSIKVDEVLTMNIYYEFDKSDIKHASELELDKFISFMKINPNVKIEISAHTDEKGTDAYNMNLSRERARNVMNYLLEEGRIDKKRIVSKGYGESMLIVKNAQTEEEHQMNRRTEIKIIGL
jgi:outer membrane protein OmpA-like peptidoglycan-associated protein